MKTKKVAKLLTFYFCNFKARRFKQGHKASLRLSAYNPSHTAVLSVLFAVMILSVFDNRTCTRCCSNSGNAHLARASSHFTTSPPRRPGQVSTFFVPFQQLEKMAAKLLGSARIWVYAKENDWHCEQKQCPTSGKNPEQKLSVCLMSPAEFL